MIKWKNRILVYIALAIIIVSFVGNQTMQAHERMDLATITDILEKEKNLKIEEWSVFAREINNKITTKAEFEDKVRTIKKKYPAFRWNITWDQDIWKAEASLPHVEKQMTESIRMVTAKEPNGTFTYIIYEMQGHHWDPKNSSAVELTFLHKMNHIFVENPSVFSCVQGSINDNMNLFFANETERLLNLFKAKEVEGVREKNFSSISAHSTLFTQTIANDEINVQVGLRKVGLGSKTRFVIGTPIITFEY